MNVKPKYMRNTPPFVRYVAAAIPMVFDDSLSYYEALCALWKYIQGMTDVINANAALEQDFINRFNNLSGKFDELKSYIDHYFDNLDVQDEINNKLDEMVEDGTLDNIILNYLQMNPMITFDTLGDAQASEQLINGSTFKTLGKETINDGYGAIYKVGTTSTDIVLQNDLYASVVEDFGGNNYYEDITVTPIRRYETDCYITVIPVNDNEGNLIAPHIEYDAGTPSAHARETFTTFTANASASIKMSGMDNFVNPIMIGDGEVLNDEEMFIGSGLEDYYTYIGIKADRSIAEYKVNNTDAQTMIAAGCVQVFDVYYKLIEHGVASDLSDIVINGNSNVTTQHHPRQCFGVKQDGTIVILTTDGRTGNDSGLTSAECQSILLEYNVYEAWNMDGGGSTSSIFKGEKINRNIDNNRSSERNIPYTLNFRKQVIDKELAKVNSRIGEEKLNALNEVYESVVQNHAKELDGSDLDDAIGEVIIGYGNNITNKPTTVGNGYFINIPHSYADLSSKYNKQFFIPRETDIMYQRKQVNGTFSEWSPLSVLAAKTNCSDTTLASGGTYTSITLQSGAFVSNSSLISLDDNNKIKLHKYLKDKIITIQIQGDVYGAVGEKFISLEINGSFSADYVQKFGNPNASYTNGFNYQFSFKYDGNDTKRFGFQVYGAQGDKFERMKVKITAE